MKSLDRKYYGATICENGHVLSSYGSVECEGCYKCGADTFSKCPICGEPIKGMDYVEGCSSQGSYEMRYYCEKCKNPLPWTQKILDNAVVLLSLDEELDEESKELIKNAIPGLIASSPIETPVSIAKYKKGISKAGQVIKDSMHQLLVDVVSETTKKCLFR